MSEYQFNPDQEQWKAICGYPAYQVSDYGSVRSFWQKFGLAGGGTTYKIAPEPQRILKPHKVCGYQRVCFKNGPDVQVDFFIHILVLTAFVGPCPPGLQCRHLDGDRLNNHSPNLCWGTALENGQDRIRHGTVPRGANHHRACAVLSESQVKDIRYLHSIGVKNASLGRLFNCHRNTISKIILGNRWAHLL